VRVSVAAYEIPSRARPELAPDYDQRTSLLAFRWFFGIGAIGLISVVLYTSTCGRTRANPLGALNRDRYAAFGRWWRW